MPDTSVPRSKTWPPGALAQTPDWRHVKPGGMGVILVVDDDDVCRELMRCTLESSGYTVVTASSGTELAGIMEHTTPALLLLDIAMQGVSGFDICQALKSDPRSADIPIIFITITAAPESKARAFALGCADYVTKPVEPIELLARIRCQLELSKHRRLLSKKANLYQTLAAERMNRLEQVRWGQTSMLTDPAAFADLKIAVRFVTAHEAGGDFYEISRLADEEFGFLVADVAGHDLSVPVLTGALKALAGLCLNESLTARETMIMLNSGLRRILTAEQYVTGCYARFSRESMSLEVVHAAHPAALIQRSNGRCEFLPGVGDVLGLFERVLFESCRIDVASGDRIFLYTDGLIEGFLDEQGRRGRPLFGTLELQKRIEDLPFMPIDQAIDAVVEQVIEQNDGVLLDDVVLLGVEF